DMVFPVWPLFVTQVLGANMAVLGLLDGLGAAMVSLSQAASGYLSDRIGKRKGFIWIGYLMGAASRVGYGLSTAWQHLVAFKLLDRAGKMRGAPRDAMVADVSTRGTRGSNFGLLRGADHLGAAVGVLICILLFPRLGYRTLFMVAALPTLVGAGVVLAIIRERPARGAEAFEGLALAGLGRDLKLLVMLSAVFALGAFSYSFLIVHAEELGYQREFIPALYLLLTVAASALSYHFGWLADRWGRRPVLAIAYGLWALVCLGCIYLRSEALLPLIFLLFGSHKAALEPAQKAIVAEFAPEGLRASVLGGFN
ncbi:MAG: MFS transporter, partial [Armatimonadota bacterium]